MISLVDILPVRGLQPPKSRLEYLRAFPYYEFRLREADRRESGVALVKSFAATARVDVGHNGRVGDFWEVSVTNPFEDETGTYHVLINEEGQHSLWPSFVEIPDGWTIVMKSDTRAACLDFINKNWTDMRPKSLTAVMDGSGGGQSSQSNQTQVAATPDQRDRSNGNVKVLH